MAGYTLLKVFIRLRDAHRQTHQNYLYSPIVTAYVVMDDGTQEEYPLKLVFVTNPKNASSYLVLATTQISLRPEEIIQMYGRRWQIEGYFKIAKQYLRLDKSLIQSYDDLCGHLAVVMITYDLLAWQQRPNEDDRTLGDLFYEMDETMPDIAVTQALAWLLKALATQGATLMGSVEGIINNIVDHFVSFLPKNLVTLLEI
ncbi:Mobile element protein [Lacticaseibacillus paracasei]|nr:Mobile element protein [Lacticaseibacillus paracasei]